VSGDLDGRSSSEGKLMQAKGFFASLFDFSFSSFITPRLVKVLYVLLTIVNALWTLLFVLIAFRSSKSFGVIALVILGPIFFVILMIGARVAVEAIIAFFRIQEDVAEINQRVGGAEATSVAPMPSSPETGPEPTSEPAPVAMSSPRPEPASSPGQVARFCESCGTRRSPGKSFCIACGASLA
jgi:uncharacterized protein DUF4282/zinc ribbon protein